MEPVVVARTASHQTLGMSGFMRPEPLMLTLRAPLRLDETGIGQVIVMRKTQEVSELVTRRVRQTVLSESLSSKSLERWILTQMEHPVVEAL